MSLSVRVEFENNADRSLDWPTEAPLPPLGYRVEIEDEPFEVVSVVLAIRPDSDPGTVVATMRLKPAFTA